MTQPNTTTDTTHERLAKLLRLAEEQGVKPIESIDNLGGNFWDAADEREETFDEWLRRTRTEGDHNRLAG